MKWSFRIATVAGIPIRVHATFALLLAWIALGSLIRGGNVGFELLFVIGVFACVVLHELGHGLMARRFGIKVRDITLLPIGGVASLERMPENPRHELLVAVTGPLVNVGLAALLFVVAAGQRGLGLAASSPFSLTGGSLPERLVAVNLTMALFNMIPAFPMDGGRVLRAVLAGHGDYAGATQAAARIGQVVAILLGFLGLFWNPFLVFVALFVYMGAEQEAALVHVRSLFRGIPVGAAMVTNYETLAPGDTLARAVQHLLAGSQQDFPVVGPGGEVVGVLPRGDLLVALGKHGDAALVGDVMRPDFVAVDPSEMLDSVLERMKGCGCGALPVTVAGTLKGLITLENISELMMVESARRGLGRGGRKS